MCLRACVYNMISPSQLYSTRSIKLLIQYAIVAINPVRRRGNENDQKLPQTNDTRYMRAVCYSIYLFVEVTYRALTIPHIILEGIVDDMIVVCLFIMSVYFQNAYKLRWTAPCKEGCCYVYPNPRCRTLPEHNHRIAQLLNKNRKNCFLTE